MKKFLIFLCAAAISASAWAVPAKRGVTYTYKQSDGSTIKVTKVGDERHHSYVTMDGLTVGRAESGDFYYRTADGLTAMMAHNSTDRTSAERLWVNAEGSKLSMAEVASKASARQKAKGSAAPKKRTQVPHTDAPKIPIILVQYTDKKMSNTLEIFTNAYDTGSKSVKQYFEDQSDKQFSPQFDLFGIYTLSSSRATYGGNDAYGDDKGVAKMVAEACQLAQAEGKVNWKDYDNDGDGECDVVMVVYAGVGEAQSDIANSVWPCQWELSDGARYGDGPGALTYGGVKIDKFAVFNEVRGSSDTGKKIDGIGTFCHEFSHCLGLPDFYDTEYSGKYFGMASWSLMDSGSYNDDGDTPCAYTAYERNFMGWRTIDNPVENTQYTLTPFINGGKAYRVQNDADKNEYYILENRQQTGWDEFVPASGLMVTHVTYSASAWEGNTVNNYSTQRMTLIPADNALKMSGYFADEANMKGDLYPYLGNNELTDESTPAAKVYTGSLMHKPITEITKDNGNVSFWYMKAVIPKEVPTLNEATGVSSDAFTASWNACEGAQSYTLFVRNADKAPAVTELVKSDFTKGLASGWSKSSSGTFTDTNYFRLGTAKATGWVKSPALNVEDLDGTTTVEVTAKSYGSDSGVTLKVSLLDSLGTSVAQQTINIAAEGTQKVVLKGGNEKCYVKLENGASSKRVMLKEVVIYSGDASVDYAPAEIGDADNRTITGITDTCYTVSNLTADANYIYKVKAVYEDGESEWSEIMNVLLGGGNSGLKGDLNHDGEVNSADISALVSMVLADDNSSDADINGDGEVNTADVSALVNLILGV